MSKPLTVLSPDGAAPGPIADLARWTSDALEWLDERLAIVSVSGGKDSTALALLLLEAGIPFRAVHMDTGWEHEDTEAYVREYLPTVIGPIKILKSKYGGMEELCLKKGMLPSRVIRFCTYELKVMPFKRHIAALHEEGEDPVNAVGIRRAESKARSQMPEREWNDTFECEVWRPLVLWTEQHVIDMHHRHGVRPSPLYLRGATRVGCWPCIFARKKEIRLIADTDPGRIDRICALEGRVTDEARKRYAARGEEFGEGQRRAWFQNPVSRTNKKTGRRAGDPWPIDRVVEWSRTAYGGKQAELFAPPYAEEGCMRWGLCETVPPKEEA